MNKKLRYYSYFVCFSVLMLILKGAMVTSHDAGLAVPDWPNSFGENMFLFPPSKWHGIIFYEHVHRLLASFVGFLTLTLTIWIWIVEKRKWVKVLSLVALLAVILQGVLGGLTVLYLLPPAVSSAHAVLAQTFFLITIVIAYSQSEECQKRLIMDSSQNTERQFNYSVLFILTVYMQLIIAAYMRHTYSGLAVTDFPTMAGSYFPAFGPEFMETLNNTRKDLSMAPVNSFQVAIHLLHRLFAVFVLISFIPLASSVIRKFNTDLFWLDRARKLIFIIAFLLVLQITLGIYTVLSLRNPWIASFHVMFGALILGLSSVAAIRFYSKN